jgi:hypothetical protein
MRESRVFSKDRARVPAFASVGLFFVLSIAACVGAEDQAGDVEDAAGVAVTVQLESGATAPGIFRGPRDQALEESGGSFHFEEGAEKVAILRRGAAWFVDDGSVEPAQPGTLAILVHREDGSIVPGGFRGPSLLAEEISESWAAARGAADSQSSLVLELPEGNPRVQVILPGTAVRTVPSA